jgi:hypothetical protein
MVDVARDRKNQNGLLTRRSRYPGYHALANPAAPGLDDVRKVLQSGEAMIALYATTGSTYAWAVNTAPARAAPVCGGRNRT